MVTRPHADIDLWGLPLLTLRLAISVGLATLSYRLVEAPIRHGAIARYLRAWRSARGEQRRRLMAGVTMTGAALVVGTMVIAVGLASAQPPGAPAGVPTEESVVIGPHASTSTAPSTSTTASSGTSPGSTTATTAPPATTTTAPNLLPARVTAIGDSVMQGAAQVLADTINATYGPDKALVDAAKNRQFPIGIDALLYYQRLGVLGDEIIIHLGTNGTINPDDFDRMMGVLSGAKRVVFVNAKVPRPWEQQVNDTLTEGVKRFKNAVLVDWHGYGGAHPEFFYDDGIHLKPEGAQAYAQLLVNALGAGTP